MRVLGQLGDVFRAVCPDLADLSLETDEFDQEEADQAA
jgi:hypothetical protein